MERTRAEDHKEMAGWLADSLDLDEDYLNGLAFILLENLVKRLYDGGLEQFRADGWDHQEVD